MTKISTYNIDENVTADDKWIGTDVNTYNRTKNFTARKLSNYFNGSQIINTGVDLLYKYFTIDPSETRPTGTLTFETEIGPTVNFSAISTFLLSKTTLKGNDVVEFLNFLVGTKILLYKAKNINLFGNYKIVSVEESLPEPNFFIVNLEFIDGNGFIEEDEDYMISPIDISGGEELQNLQQVTDLGNTTTFPIIANSFVKNGGTGNNLLLDNGLTVPIASIGGNQNLQEVTDLGANTTNSITANSFVKDGGTSSEILAANGDIITAGNNITITNGEISSVGGGGGGGGASVNYYLNGGTSQGTFGGTTYYEFSKTAVIGTRVDFSVSSDGYIASFITDVADPSLLLIPIGNWIIEFYFSANSAGGSPSFYTELYKVSETNIFTLISSSSGTPEGITNGDVIDAYFTTLSVPETPLDINDRLAIRIFVNNSGKTITLHTQDETLCEVITTFTSGLTALNGLQAQVQNFATGTTGEDFAINSSGSKHTFNLPSASATARGVVTKESQTFAGDKTFTGDITAGASIIAAAIPTTSLGSYNILTRNAGSGVFEKLETTNIQPLVYNILIESTIGITTQKLGVNGGQEYSQDGRNVMINNLTTPITVTATNASNSFIASYTKLGTASITFVSSPTIIAPYGNILNGSVGSTALLTKNGTTVYLLVNNLL